MRTNITKLTGAFRNFANAPKQTLVPRQYKSLYCSSTVKTELFILHRKIRNPKYMHCKLTLRSKPVRTVIAGKESEAVGRGGGAYKIQFLLPVNVFPGAYKKCLLMHPVVSTRGTILIIKPSLQGEFAVHKNNSLAFIIFTSILQQHKKGISSTVTTLFALL